MPLLVQGGESALVNTRENNCTIEEVSVVDVPPGATAVAIDWHAHADLHVMAWRVGSGDDVGGGGDGVGERCWSRPVVLDVHVGGTSHVAVPVLDAAAVCVFVFMWGVYVCVLGYVVHIFWSPLHMETHTYVQIRAHICTHTYTLIHTLKHRMKQHV